MKLSYTLRAARDSMRLRDFIPKKHPQAARKASHQLKKNIQNLVDDPRLGAPVDDLGGFCERVARDCIVRYRVLPDESVILNIWHGKEDQ